VFNTVSRGTACQCVGTNRCVKGFLMILNTESDFAFTSRYKLYLLVVNRLGYFSLDLIYCMPLSPRVPRLLRKYVYWNFPCANNDNVYMFIDIKFTWKNTHTNNVSLKNEKLLWPTTNEKQQVLIDKNMYN